MRLQHRGRRRGVLHDAYASLSATGVRRPGRGPLLLRHLTAISVARRMGRLEAARYIVADAAHRDAVVRRRAAAHHGRDGEPDDAIGARGWAAHRVRAWRHSGCRPGAP